jgi:hypothetical protein
MVSVLSSKRKTVNGMITVSRKSGSYVVLVEVSGSLVRSNENLRIGFGAVLGLNRRHRSVLGTPSNRDA